MMAKWGGPLGWLAQLSGRTFDMQILCNFYVRRGKGGQMSSVV